MRKSQAERYTFFDPLFVEPGPVFFASARTIYRQRHGLEYRPHAGLGSRYLYLSQLIIVWLLLLAKAKSRWVTRWALIPLSAFAPKIRAGVVVTIPINPFPWKIPLPARASASPQLPPRFWPDAHLKRRAGVDGANASRARAPPCRGTLPPGRAKARASAVPASSGRSHDKPPAAADKCP